MTRIESLQNEKIKRIIKLRKASQRKKIDSIIIEGKKEIELALSSNIKIFELYYCPEIIKKFDLKIDNQIIVEVSKEVFEKISYRDTPDGYLAIARPKFLEIDEVELSKNPLILVLENVEKPGNLGALLRTCDASGADLVILNKAQTDIYNPNVIRASRGTVFTSQIVALSIDKTKKFLEKNKIQILTATDKARKNYFEIDLRKPTAIVLGAEHDGLSKEWLEASFEKAKIPMKGKIDSLNVSVSGAVIIYEALRQRES